MPARIPEETRIQQINSRPNTKFISWVGTYTGSRTRAILKCTSCDNQWETTAFGAVKSGGCSVCSGYATKTQSEREMQISELRGIRFVSWCNWGGGAKSTALVSCDNCGGEWVATVNNLVNHGRGCPHCAPSLISKVKRLDDNEITDRISMIDGVSFVRFIGKYKNAKSRIAIRCDTCSFEWDVSSGSILNGDSRCPACARTGYDPKKNGTLYALRSECGRHIKIGISNKPKIRICHLAKKTPFRFNVIETITSRDGRIAEMLERYFHKKYGRSGLSGFDGATEWLPFSGALHSDLIEKKRIYEGI